MDVSLPHRNAGGDRPLPVGPGIPPGHAPPFQGRRALKRWRYAGVYGDAYMLCVGSVSIAGLPQWFWALWDREGRRLREHTALGRGGGRVGLADGVVSVRDRGIHIDLRYEAAGDDVEVLSDHHGGRAWTRKRPIAATGTVTVDGTPHAFAAAGLIDDTAAYYARTTDWEWAAGVGTADDGKPVAWNLVTGVHDAPRDSERTIWIDGEATEPGPVVFSEALDRVVFAEGGELRFNEESARRSRQNLIVIASDYVQPFGTATGTLGGVTLAEGFGVMERHHARW
jgi:hypothetical protein